MKASKRKANTGMVYYLKKFWGPIFWQSFRLWLRVRSKPEPV